MTLFCYHPQSIENSPDQNQSKFCYPTRKMKLAAQLISTAIILCLLIAAFAIWFLYGWSREMSPETYAIWLDADPARYRTVESIPESDLQLFAYAYEKNKFVDAIPGAARRPKIADDNGHVPAFKLGDDVFILTWKWTNNSAGLALSDSPNFISKIESLDDHFRVRHLSGNIFEWKLDLDSPRSGTNAR